MLTRRNHHYGIILKSDKTKNETFEDLQKALDVAVLNDSGVYIMAWDFSPTKIKTNGGNGSGSEIKSGVSSLLSKAPGLVAFLKKYKWWQLYIGAAFMILLVTFVWKLLT